MYATVPGGDYNVASRSASLAVGQNANAVHDGSFVWADTQSETYSSDGPNQFKIRAGGGVVMDVDGAAGMVINNSGSGDIFKGFDADFNGDPVFEVGNDGSVYSRGMNLSSDRNAKENFAAVHQDDILDKLARLPITSWNFKLGSKSQRHIGPMAQDFHAAFPLNADDKHISLGGEAGVAFAAIQALNQRLRERDAELATQHEQIADLKARLAAIEQTLAAAGK